MFKYRVDIREIDAVQGLGACFIRNEVPNCEIKAKITTSDTKVADILITTVGEFEYIESAKNWNQLSDENTIYAVFAANRVLDTNTLNASEVGIDIDPETIIQSDVILEIEIEVESITTLDDIPIIIDREGIFTYNVKWPSIWFIPIVNELKEPNSIVNLKVRYAPNKYKDISAYIIQDGSGVMQPGKNWNGCFDSQIIGIGLIPLTKIFKAEWFEPDYNGDTSDLTSSVEGILNILIDVQSAPTSIEYSYDSSGNRISRRIINVASRTLMSYEEPKEIVQEKISKRDVKIYSAIQGQVTIEVSTLEGMKNGTVQVIAFGTGNVIATKKIQNLRENLDLSSQASGIYVLLVDIDGEKTSYKLMK